MQVLTLLASRDSRALEPQVGCREGGAFLSRQVRTSQVGRETAQGSLSHGGLGYWDASWPALSSLPQGLCTGPSLLDQLHPSALLPSSSSQASLGSSRRLCVRRTSPPECTLLSFASWFVGAPSSPPEKDTSYRQGLGPSCPLCPPELSILCGTQLVRDKIHSWAVVIGDPEGQAAHDPTLLLAGALMILLYMGALVRTRSSSRCPGVRHHGSSIMWCPRPTAAD